ncbi:3'-5' exonuclease [Peribacillus loiseleuriae]|uniref:UvrD-like helicase C-terminal domain-containing protein n=1 Tax=Peribacillus loiseleuriae TaxID=1679170 RepID=A0A0K9GTA1_9BACI|nr:3'-5' exonuclease [Peribacillus loiseleuriae]KMY49853.1 hypothetical protein AC625_10210 [Peribacillus loiseleuriae]
MDINYRSGGFVVGLANPIIRHNTRQIPKTLKVNHSDNQEVSLSRPLHAEQEAEWIIQDILDKQSSGHALRDMAILYRTHAIGRAVFDKLVLADIVDR